MATERGRRLFTRLPVPGRVPAAARARAAAGATTSCPAGASAPREIPVAARPAPTTIRAAGPASKPRRDRGRRPARGSGARRRAAGWSGSGRAAPERLDEWCVMYPSECCDSAAETAVRWWSAPGRAGAADRVRMLPAQGTSAGGYGRRATKLRPDSEKFRTNDKDCLTCPRTARIQSSESQLDIIWTSSGRQTPVSERRIRAACGDTLRASRLLRPLPGRCLQAAPPERGARR